MLDNETIFKMGVIMIMKKKSLLFFASIIVAILFFVAAGCASPEEVQPVDDPAEPAEEEVAEVDEEVAAEPEGEATFTLDELAQYDGQDGRPAYIAVDGVVYDVTDVPPWSGGMHFGFDAGADVTEALQSAAPHGAGQLSQAEVVGVLAE